MQEGTKVFSSDITRGQKTLRNNLYDLLNIVPVNPSKVKNDKEFVCDFHAKHDKQYLPKKRNRQKVKTVRDIRNLLERDVYTYLPSELEKQQNILLKKITGGSARKEHTKKLANNLIKSGNPISRTSWQMLMNLNPEGHLQCIQYVLWKGKRIRVNGSKGGKSKFLCNYDLSTEKVTFQNKSFIRRNATNKKKSLLHNSLTIKFKPGPLRKKKYLDDSYQKYNVGSTELVNLPKLGLDVQPTYGVVLDPNISNLLQNIRDINGVISKKWAEFSVSMIGSLTSSHAIQNDSTCCVNFDLNYKSNQHLILMRRDIDNTCEKIENHVPKHVQTTSEYQISNIELDVKIVIENILSCVEISLKQDDMYTGYDEPRETSVDQYINTHSNLHTKDKIKRNKELDRLDVTIIRLPEVSQKEASLTCLKSHCTLGCICASLQCTYNFKQHCGRVNCMFECKCDFSKYKANDTFGSSCPELIPGLLNLDNEINLRLAKEEQKFHQTVVVTGEKSVLLKSEKRNWKASKRYGDFYNSLCLKSEMKSKQILKIIVTKLNCENVEPWCMVHNLYKCFCKGKFTETLSLEKDQTDTSESKIHKVEHPDVESYVSEKTEQKITNPVETHLRPSRQSADKKIIDNENTEQLTDNLIVNHPRTLRQSGVKKIIRHSISDRSDSDFDQVYIGDRCARVEPYEGRKYYNSYYMTTNKKILEMEKNDSKLQKRMMSLVNKVDTNTNVLEEIIDTPSNKDDVVDVNMTSFNDNSLKVDETLIPSSSLSSDEDNISCEGSIIYKLSKSTSKPLINKSLICWLEASYKQYKERADRGIFKKSLDPPKEGKAALYPWEFILSRYRDRKNLFLISKEKPFRIFMAVDRRSPFFDNCINIDDIRFSDLHKYPLTIKNLLTNATELKDNFCILCGLSHCWELIGAVTKLKERSNSGSDFNITESSGNDTSSVVSRHDELESELTQNVSDNSGISIQEIKENHHKNTVDKSAFSNWFVMTVENDFSEMQFSTRGFFVKYESIIKAINVARMSGKTVRLSSQKCAEQSSGPQYGIYAIPNTDEYCVFIGPYDKDEPIGIETVKSILNVKKTKRTRGVWITTKKVDNLKVIDNPLSFLPPKNVHPSKIVALESELISNESITDDSEYSTDVPNVTVASVSTKELREELKSNEHQTKIVKPIKIRKTNGFYHLAPEGFLKHFVHSHGEKQIAPSTGSNSIIKPIYLQYPSYQNDQNLRSVTTPSLISMLTTNKTQVPVSNSLDYHSTPSTLNAPPNKNKQISINLENKKPVAEIAPQIKIVDVYSESEKASENKTTPKKSEKGMFILKPEEINKRLIEKQMNEKDCIDEDIENFLANSEICTFQNADVFVVSDEEEDSNKAITDEINYKYVWIESTTIENIGCLRGVRNCENDLSFEFPGFKFTEFYKEQDAFSKINQVLSRKVYIPKNLTLEWRVVQSKKDLKSKHLLKSDELGIDFILTKRGLRHKRDLMANVKNIKKSTNSVTAKETPQSSPTSSQKSYRTVFENDVDEATDLFNEIEEQRESVEDEGNLLLNELQKKSGLIRSFHGISDNQRAQIAEDLQKFTCDK